MNKLITSRKEEESSQVAKEEPLVLPNNTESSIESEETNTETYQDSKEEANIQQTVVAVIKPPSVVNESKEIQYSDSETIQEHRRNLYLLFHRNFGKDWMVFLSLFYWPKRQQHCLSYIRSLPDWMKNDESWMKKRATYYALARKIMDCYFEIGFDGTLELIQGNKYRLWWSEVQGMRKMKRQLIISSDLYKQLNPKKNKSEVIEDFEIISAEEWEKERRKEKQLGKEVNAVEEKSPTLLTQADLLRRLHSTANRYQELFHKYMKGTMSEDYELREFLELERKRAMWQRKCEEYDEEQETLFLESKK